MSSYGYPSGDGVPSSAYPPPPSTTRDRFWSTPPAGGGGDPWGSNGSGGGYTPQLDFSNSSYLPYGSHPGHSHNGGSPSTSSSTDITFSGPSPPNPTQLQPISGGYTPSSTPTPLTPTKIINGINGNGNGSLHSNSPSANSNSGSPTNPGGSSGGGNGNGSSGNGRGGFSGFLEEHSSPLQNGHGSSATLLNLGGKNDQMVNGGYNGPSNRFGQDQIKQEPMEYQNYHQGSYYHQGHQGYGNTPTTTSNYHQSPYYPHDSSSTPQNSIPNPPNNNNHGQPVPTPSYKATPPYDPYGYPQSYNDQDYFHQQHPQQPHQQQGPSQHDSSPASIKERKGSTSSSPKDKLIYNDNPPIGNNFGGAGGTPPTQNSSPPQDSRKSTSPSSTSSEGKTKKEKKKGNNNQSQNHTPSDLITTIKEEKEDVDQKKGKASEEAKGTPNKRKRKRKTAKQKEAENLANSGNTSPNSNSNPTTNVKKEEGGNGGGGGKGKKKSQSPPQGLEDGDETGEGGATWSGDEGDEKGNKDVQMVECGCFPADEVHAEPGPFYTHLGAAHDLVELRKLVETRTGFRGNQVRLEKVIYSGKEGKTNVGCPLAKWILRRGSYEEQLLFLVKHRKGHKCSTAWIVVCVVIWEGVPPHFSDNLYDTMVYKLNRFGIPTTRRSDTNEQRSCACQGVDPDSCGAAYSFGCAWSMFFNGCKYARSRNVRKFRLTEEHEESELEEKIQHLATHLGPLYDRVAPDSYTNQIDHENEGLECRLGYRPGRPFSGVTACVDYCSHAHKDAHNMMNGCTVTVSLTRHRTISKPEDEQYHVLPLYKLDDTDEYGSKEGQKAKVKKGQLEILKKFPCKVRIRKVPLLPSRRRAKAKTAAKTDGTSATSSTTPAGPASGSGSPGTSSSAPKNPVSDFSSDVPPPLKREKLFDERLPSLPLNGDNISQYPNERFHPSPYGQHQQGMNSSINSTTGIVGPLGGNSELGGHGPSWAGSTSPRGSSLSLSGPPTSSAPSSYFDHTPSASSALSSLTELTNSTISRGGSSSNLTSPGSSSGYSSMSPILPSFRNTFMTEDSTPSTNDSTSLPSPRALSSKPGSSAFQDPSSHNNPGYPGQNHSYPTANPTPQYPSGYPQSNPCLPNPTPGYPSGYDPHPHSHPHSHHSMNMNMNMSHMNMNPMNSNPYMNMNSAASFGMGVSPWGSASGYGASPYSSAYGSSHYPSPSHGNFGVGVGGFGNFGNMGNPYYQGNVMARPTPPPPQPWAPPNLTPFQPPHLHPQNPHQIHQQPLNPHPQSLNPLSVNPQQNCFVTPPKPKVIPEVNETTSDNEDCFKDPQMGGVAIALTHGSVILQCAKHEMHATTALKNPNRMYPSRVCLIFYQHKSMNNRFHGWSEWEKKIEAKKLQEVKLINQGKMEASPRKMKQLIKEGYIQDQ